MASSIKMNDEQFKKGMAFMRRTYGTTSAGVMRRQMSIMAGQLVKRYPPFKMSEGKQALENDLKKIMISVPPEHEDTLTRWQDDLESTLDVFDDTGVRIEQWHKQHRDPRTHRVKNAIDDKTFTHGRDFSHKLHVRQRDLMRYVNRIAKNSIGTLKGGWSAGLRKWKGGKKPPSWVKTNAENGIAIDRMKDDGSGFLQIVNLVKGANRWKRIDRFVMRSREKGFEKEIKSAVKTAEKEMQRKAFYGGL